MDVHAHFHAYQNGFICQSFLLKWTSWIVFNCTYFMTYIIICLLKVDINYCLNFITHVDNRQSDKLLRVLHNCVATVTVIM